MRIFAATICRHDIARQQICHDCTEPGPNVWLFLAVGIRPVDPHAYPNILHMLTNGTQHILISRLSSISDSPVPVMLPNAADSFMYSYVPESPMGYPMVGIDREIRDRWDEIIEKAGLEA